MAGNPAGLSADHIGRLEALGALEQIKLHRFAFVERAVAILLNRGEMDEHVFASGALDEPVTFSPVEPLHCTLLSHKNSFRRIAKNSFFPALVEAPGFWSAPQKDAKNKVALPCAAESEPKRKAPGFYAARSNYGAKLWSSEMLARISTGQHSNVNPKLQDSLPIFRQRAQDNIQEHTSWQEKKFPNDQ